MSYEFADRLIEMRRARGLSQEELARQLGLSRQAVSKWERAESAPDVGNLVALAGVYEVTLDELVRGPEPAAVESADDASDAVDAEPAAAKVEEPSEAASETAASEVASAPEPEVTPDPAVAPESAPATEPAAAPSAAAEQATPPPPTTSPVFMAAPEARKVKNPMLSFPYPVLVAFVYLVMGMFFGLWHPGWIIFFTIPFYYWIASVVSHDPEFIAHHAGPKG